MISQDTIDAVRDVFHKGISYGNGLAHAIDMGLVEYDKPFSHGRACDTGWWKSSKITPRGRRMLANVVTRNLTRPESDKGRFIQPVCPITYQPRPR